MSTTTQHSQREQILDRAVEAAEQSGGSGGPPPADLHDLLGAYYRHVATEDLVDRSHVDVYGAFASHSRLGAERKPGETLVGVYTPTVGEHGWTAAGHTVVEVVTDDMPFLVDSLTMELSRQLHGVHLVLHPTYDVNRDDQGRLQSMRALGRGAPPATGGAIHESWMHVEIDRLGGQLEQREADELEADIQRVLADVRVAVEDWELMVEQVGNTVSGLADDPPPLPEAEVQQGIDLLRWLADDRFTFLGYREYRLDRGNGDVDDMTLAAVEGSGLGILRDRPGEAAKPMAFNRLPEAVREKAREQSLLLLAKANSRSTVHRPAYLDYIGIKEFNEDGHVVGERRFLGLFSSAAYTESLTRIPVLREKVDGVLERTGLDPRSHDGNALLDTLETYPRDELFHTPVDELAPIAEAAMQARERRAVRLFIRRDIYGRYLSVLVYLPRDRYNTNIRHKFVRLLEEELGADSVEFNVNISESTTARVHFVVRRSEGKMIPDDVDTDVLERRMIEVSRSWHDDFAQAVTAEFGEDVGATLGRRYVDSFPEAYKEDYNPRVAAVDVGRIETIQGEIGVDQALYAPLNAAPGEARLKIYRIGDPLSLSDVLPMISSMGVEVIDERPYRLDDLERRTDIYDFGLRYGTALPDRAQELFCDALRAMWDHRNEVDGFNALILRAELTWRQALLLRAYAKYMKQGHSPFAVDSIETALVDNVAIARLLVDLFETRFDPDLSGDREQRELDLVGQVESALDQVASLDHDRIMRSYLAHIRATLRTNYFQTADESGTPKAYLSLKLEPSAIPGLPEPRPAYEIFVYSPRVEGVHLRFGAVARGGLRWSDRRDDFRTEILGLVKAQMVKNTVIVPVGSKGGFYAKQLPDSSDREAWQAEGIACYRTFISGLLDVTDNRVDEDAVAPPRVIRHDGDDPYLVVAADKGTATFSDIANEVSESYGFWLGDAFASGGSVGYDHKAMGITARGAWVSVQRHFREMGIDCQTEEFTCVGVGDMSGDVFGNGMLCSRSTRLVAAFDHRDIFIDPSPDAETSYAERKRLFETPRSSWQDYDTSLISEGGGVFSRSLKSITITPQIRTALGLDSGVTSMTPNELMRAVLLAPVDLFWNGGIGTYVKGAAESDSDVGDKANDAIRVNGRDLRVRAVGEGGNLGLTQRGRIEYASQGAGGAGGRVNTDFIDNSAGVDTSDHEVNLKILLDRVVAAGDLTRKQRNELLASMTDEVAQLVLRDNYEQNLALANANKNAPSLLHVHEQWMRDLEKRRRLDRKLEALPSSKEVRRRIENGGALTSPELSVLLSYTKIILAEELIETDLPDDPYLARGVVKYFPTPVQEGFAPQIEQHPLRREIIVTQVVNDLINGAGFTYWQRLAAETGSSAAELTRANFVARDIFGAQSFWRELEGYDTELDAALVTRMRVEMRTLVERASRWLITNRRQPLDSEATVELFAEPVQAAMTQLPDLLTGRELAAYERRQEFLLQQGVPEDLAGRVAGFDVAYLLLNVVDIAARENMEAPEVARVHFALGDRLGLSALGQQVVSLPREDQWQTMARAAMRDDLHSVHAQLTASVLEATDDAGVAEDRVAEWESSRPDVIARGVETLDHIAEDEETDLARVSVALRVVRSLLS